MAPGGSGLQIVRTWCEPNAPTGEGSRYQTEDGRVWKPVFVDATRGTGEDRGRHDGDRIKPEANS